MSKTVHPSHLYLLDNNDFIMGKIIGCCGIICSDCQIFEATQNQDDDLRAILFQRQIEWGHSDRFRELYGREYRLDDIHCDGCPTSSPDDFWYIQNCEMRACALNKGYPNCAYCMEYPCDLLQSFFDKSHVNARKTLDRIRTQLQ